MEVVDFLVDFLGVEAPQLGEARLEGAVQTLLLIVSSLRVNVLHSLLLQVFIQGRVRGVRVVEFEGLNRLLPNPYLLARKSALLFARHLLLELLREGLASMEGFLLRVQQLIVPLGVRLRELHPNSTQDSAIVLSLGISLLLEEGLFIGEILLSEGLLAARELLLFLLGIASTLSAQVLLVDFGEVGFDLVFIHYFKRN